MASPKPPLHLYRDCMRLISHLAPGSSPKSLALRSTLRREWDKNRSVTDQAKIEDLRGGAVRGLANYLTLVSSSLGGSGGGSAAKATSGGLRDSLKSYEKRSIKGMERGVEK